MPTPSKVTILTKKGRDIPFDLFHINDNFTALAMGTSKGQGEIRILCGKNLSQADPTREVEINLESQVLKHLFLPVPGTPDVQSLYYTTLNGVFYIGR